MDDYDHLCSLFAQGDKFHADLVPEIFQEFSGPHRPRERLQHFMEVEAIGFQPVVRSRRQLFPYPPRQALG